MRGVAVLKAVLLAAALGAAPGVAAVARADEIQVTEASLEQTEDGMLLAADFDFELNPRLAEVVQNGVPLYFLVEFELTRARWWWFDEKAAAKRLQVRLSYHALSRHYRLSTGVLQQNYATLEEALNVLRHLRRWHVADRGSLQADVDYQAAVRMRLDSTQLPKPFQLNALTTRELTLESPWKRFTFRPTPQLPAPVESRQPHEVPEK